MAAWEIGNCHAVHGVNKIAACLDSGGNASMGESMPTTLQAPHSVIGDYCAYLRVTHISTEQVRNASTGSRISIMAILQGLQKLSGFGERGG